MVLNNTGCLYKILVSHIHSEIESRWIYVTGKLSRKGSYQTDIRGYKLTSDESSTGRENMTNSSIVRKTKKSKEFSRRRSLSHSPKNQKHKNPCESDYQTASLPSILRKKCAKFTTSSGGKGCSR